MHPDTSLAFLMTPAYSHFTYYINASIATPEMLAVSSHRLPYLGKLDTVSLPPDLTG